MSEINNGRLSLYWAEYSKCNHKKKLGFKGLNQIKLQQSYKQKSCTTVTHKLCV